MTITKFFSTNKEISLLIFGYTAVIWVFSSLFPMILSKHYGYSDSALSFLVTEFVITFFFGSLWMSLELEKTINYGPFLTKLFLSFTTVIALSGCTVIFDFSHYLLFSLRVLEGLLSGMISVLFSYILKHILIYHVKNGTINSIYSSGSYLLKAFIPIISATLFIIPNHEASIYFAGSFFFLLLTILSIIVQKHIFFKYQLFIMRKLDKPIETKKFHQSFQIIKKFFTKDDNFPVKINYALASIFQNTTRPFYDLYMGLLLVKYFQYSIIEAVSIVAFMVAGQASQLFSGALSDKINLSHFRLLGITIYSLAFLSIVLLTEPMHNIFFAYAVFYFLGLGRSYWASYEYKLSAHLTIKGVKINHLSFVHNFIAESSHYLSYFVFGLFLYFGTPLHTIFAWPLISIVGLFLVWYFFDRKTFPYEKKISSIPEISVNL